MTLMRGKGLRLGVAYYPEQWPRTRWSTDAEMMVEAGLTVARVGEFAWSAIEPELGRFDLDWLEEAPFAQLDVRHAVQRRV